jgi:2-oxoglutarate dehydrogenase E2 component (dihydrolipoamide succinyltransferase)
MARVELIIPKMGESVTEATVISWNKNVGDIVEMDETIIEIATDKVDSEVPSTNEGKLVEQLFQVDDVVKVGQAFAILETGEDDSSKDDNQIESLKDKLQINEIKEDIKNISGNSHVITEGHISKINIKDSDRFYSPLVKNMATKEGVSIEELEGIQGTGKDGRVTKNDMALYINSRGVEKLSDVDVKIDVDSSNVKYKNVEKKPSLIQSTGDTEIVEMDRMRKLISSHMTMSKQTSAHITSFVEADMTKIVNWRNKAKKEFKEREGENITFTPIIIEAMVKAVKDFPLINVSVEGTNIHIHKNINVGMAAALPDGNLIVPVIDECQNKNLYGITKSVNDLAMRARAGELKPDEISGGTITMTNVGTFGNLMGTPIINQPQVAIMACGIIKKKPVVMEIEHGDVIAIRHMMFLSLSYDHRVVDGALGGQFVRRVADYLENFDTNTLL